MVTDRTPSVLYANRRACELLGVSPSEVLALRADDPRWQAMAPDGTPLDSAGLTVLRAIRTRQPVRNEIVGYARGPNERIWLQVSCAPVLDAAGEVDAVYLTLTAVSRAQIESSRGAGDITAPVQALPTVEEQRELLRRVIHAVPGVLYRHTVRLDESDSFGFVSARAADVLGIDPGRICESSAAFWERMHPKDAVALRAAITSDAIALRASARAGLPIEQRFDEEFRMAMPDGTWRWLRAQSLGTLAGDDMVCYGVITDITERRQLADQLRVSQRQELIGVMVSGVAHNFNNMLAAIVPNLERATQHGTGEMAQELTDAYDAARGAADLVRTLMLLVRHDEPHTSEPLDVVALVQDVVRMCRRMFDQRITLESTMPAAPVMVRGRRSELQQVVLNLFINARDALETPGATDAPRITAEVRPLDDRRVAVDVRDNGIGMDEETSRRVGQPFFTTKPPGKGTGLGIATASGIARDMGGELTWSSRPGGGSSFSLVLPLAPGADVAAGSPVGAARRRFNGQLVLAIDDEPLVRKTLGRLLESLGLRTVLAATGEEGLAIVRDRDDLAAVLLDLSMPGLPGIDVLRHVRTLRPSLPVFVVSGWVAEPESLQSASGVIRKPFTARELADALAGVLREELGGRPN